MNNIKKHLRKYLTLTLALVLTVLSANSLIQPVYASSQEPVYTLATDADFSGTQNGEFRYIGTATHVRIPNVIKGVPVTSYKGMFSYTSVEGVYSDNRKITDMSWMFNSSKASNLDISNLDTRNVADMSWMFSGANAKNLDLSGFNTQNVSDMSNMFYSSSTKELDLSSFNLKRLANAESIFTNSSLTLIDMSSFTLDDFKLHGDHLLKGLTSSPKIYLSSQKLIDNLNTLDSTYFSYYSGRTALVKSNSKQSVLSAPAKPEPVKTEAVQKRSMSTMTTMSTTGGTTGPNGEFIPPGYELATDSDFIIYPPVMPQENPKYRYKGTKPYVVIPHKINGVTLEGYDYWSMFDGEEAKHVRGVASNNPRITSTMFMFAYNPAPSLDLRYFDTSNIKGMLGMFLYNKASTINLSTWDTSKVTTMIGMFRSSQVKSINLDHFDCSSLISTHSMFKNASATSISFKSFNLAPMSQEIANRYYYASIGEMFVGTKITSIDLSGFNPGPRYFYSGEIVILVEGDDGPYLRLMAGGIFNESSVKTVYVSNPRAKTLLGLRSPGLNIIVK